jgi:DMSO/TMAO reductase YedYZ molybdopterin-dependent catalytic subunit
MRQEQAPRAHVATALDSVLGVALIGAAAGMLTSVVVSSLFGVLVPAQIFGDRITPLIPLPVFSAVLGLLGQNAKHVFFVVLLTGEGVLTALVGVLYWRLRPAALSRLRRGRQTADAEDFARLSYLDVPVLVALLWLLSAGILAPLLGGGLFGAGLVGGVLGVFGAELIPNLVFAIAFMEGLRRLPESSGVAPTPTAEGARVSRRRLLRQTGVAVAILAGGAVAWELISHALGFGGRGQNYPLSTANTPTRIVPPPQPTYGPWTPIAGQTPEVTPTPQFYYVSKNLNSDPSVVASGWQLQIGGLVDQPYSLGYNDLLGLPYTERYHTLECISNEVGGNLMSNASFRGVALADLLNHAGIRTGANELIFRAADGYSDSLHLSQALDPRSLVVYLINGQPLPQAHGFPARLLVPGLYGMKNGKWLTSLEVGTGSYTGYWEQQGWDREARVKMTSRIDVPADGDVLSARPTYVTYVAGVAYAADRGIAQVEVTTDGGATWQQATLRSPLGALTWVLWEYPWTPVAGTYILAVRAIDLDGNVQTPVQAPPLPNGASGYDAIEVAVR